MTREEFLKNLWHSAEEEPEPDVRFLYESDDGFFKVMTYDVKWPFWVALFSIVRWCYVSELLPEGSK